MEIPTKALKDGFSLPVYGLGLWKMGGSRTADYTNDARDIVAIQTAIEKGVTHIDTAEKYGAGHAEELLCKAIEGYDRKKLQIATKVASQNQTYDGVLRSCEASLSRIGSDYIDLYLLHSYPDRGIKIEETMLALDELVRQGMVRNIGVCNMTPRRFDLAQKNSKNKLVCNQVHYNVKFREIEAKEVLKHAQDNDVFVVAWRPVQKGSLPESDIIRELSAKYEKTPTQIAINWLVSQPNVVTIAKTSSIEHLEENLGAIGWDMDKEDIERIRQEFPGQEAVSDAVPLNYDAADGP